MIGVDTELLKAFDDYRTYGNTSAERVRFVLMKLTADKANKTNYFMNKFVHKVDSIFSSLPKPREWQAFRVHDLPLLTSIDDEVQAVAVHRSNNQNRDATPGQKAMAFAMQFPEGTNKGGRGKTSILDIEVSKPYITKARYVLRNSPMVEGERYPRRCLDIMNGLISLTEAYELAQQDFKDREKKEREAKEISAKRADLESRYPDLAALVAEDRLSLSKAIAAAEQARVPVDESPTANHWRLGFRQFF